MKKPILCLDFDGVLHSYTSGWQGVDVIPDPPVPGAIEFLDKAVEKFEVHIYSSRSGSSEGRFAMAVWLNTKILRAFAHDPDRALEIMKAIEYPTEKPPALVTIDDRAVTFTGSWPNIEELLNFKPWNKK